MSRCPRVWLVAMALAFLLVASAPTDDDDGEDAPSGNSAVSSSSTTLFPGAARVANLLSANGDAMLIRRLGGYWSAADVRICDNAPFILSRDGPSNQNCLPALNDAGVSCTCLTGFSKPSPTWEFRVSQKRKTTGTPPKAVDATSTLAITKIAPFVLAETVKTVNILGDASATASIAFVEEYNRKGDKLFATLQASNSIKAKPEIVRFENLDLSSVITKADLFRPSVTQLTLRNCNLSDGSTAFFTSLSMLETINLENNKFTKIPRELFQLPRVTKVFLSGNTIASATVTQNEFQIIKAMKVFFVDSSASAKKCPQGELKAAQEVTFCVSDTASTVPQRASPQGGPGGSRETDTTPVHDAPSSNTTKYLLIGAITGSVVIVILIFLIVRRRSSRQKQDAFVKQQDHSVMEDTMSFDHSSHSHQSAIASSLVNDPIIITHRIPYNDVKVATCISRGGFGLVYSGTFNRRRVAIKRIRSDLSADIKYIEAFLKEICLMASLNHPRIVEFVGVAWDSLRNLSAVTEFMERGDLRDVLHGAKTRNARLTWDGHKVRIAMHIAEALTYLHSLSPKVIHRDLKSKNVLLDSDMTAKLSDFGVSRERRFEETHMTAGVGTAFWIAPEVLLGMDYDERADIFSFGVVLSEIDTDDYPYWNEANPALGGKQQENVILRMVATGALRPEFSPECPSSILELAHACLDVDPAKRPTAAEIAYRLQQLMRSSPLTADVSVVLSPNEETKRSSV